MNIHEYQGKEVLRKYGVTTPSTGLRAAEAASQLAHIDVLKMFSDDPGTDAVIMAGEIGGDAQETRGRWIKHPMRKPVVGFNPAEMGSPPASLVGPECLPFD
jgi:succinyl-CoA synthetase alpha subunit